MGVQYEDDIFDSQEARFKKFPTVTDILDHRIFITTYLIKQIEKMHIGGYIKKKT